MEPEIVSTSQLTASQDGAQAPIIITDTTDQLPVPLTLLRYAGTSPLTVDHSQVNNEGITLFVLQNLGLGNVTLNILTSGSTHNRSIECAPGTWAKFYYFGPSGNVITSINLTASDTVTALSCLIYFGPYTA